MIDKLKNSLKRLLEEEKREEAIRIALDHLGKDRVSVTELYVNVLVPILQGWDCDYMDEALCIWKEHMMSSTIRTIIECCAPQVIRETGSVRGVQKRGKAVIVCPPEELHELGARMAADIFRINGYGVVFVGASTPVEAFMRGLESYVPDFVAISVSNYYNLVNAAKMVSRVKDRFPSMKTIVSGPALANNSKALEQIDADIYLEDLQAIASLDEEVKP